jgi:hypothetical protein
MAFRFRRSTKLLPGILINLGKRSVSLSVGGRGGNPARAGRYHLKLEAGLVAVLMCFASGAAHAHDARCDAPPYGDSQLNYNALFDGFTRASKSEPTLPPNLLTGMMQSTMKMACDAKFGGGDRTMFYQAGLSDRDIDVSSTATLTNAWFDSRNKAHAHEASKNQSADENRCSRPPYGDTVAKFKAFTAKYQSTDATSLVSVLERTCRAKFDGGDRRALYTAGLTDQEIEAGSTVSLATTWMDVTIRGLQGKSSAKVTHSQSGTTAYAMFICFHGTCTIHGEPHIVGPHSFEYTPFRTLADCRREMTGNSSHLMPDKDNRIVFNDGSIWECRGKHVDTWEPTQ